MKEKSYTRYDKIFDGFNSVGGTLSQEGVDASIIYAGAASRPFNLNSNFVVNTVIFDGDNSVFLENNVQAFSPMNLGDHDMGGFTLGCQGNITRFGHFEVKEIILRNSVAKQIAIYKELKKIHGL